MKDFEFGTKRKLYISIWEQWREMFAKREQYNWKNFSVVELSFEYCDHLYPKGSFEIVFQLIGFGLRIQYIPDKPPTEDMKHLQQLRDDVIGDKNDDVPVQWC